MWGLEKQPSRTDTLDQDMMIGLLTIEEAQDIIEELTASELIEVFTDSQSPILVGLARTQILKETTKPDYAPYYYDIYKDISDEMLLGFIQQKKGEMPTAVCHNTRVLTLRLAHLNKRHLTFGSPGIATHVKKLAQRVLNLPRTTSK